MADYGGLSAPTRAGLLQLDRDQASTAPPPGVLAQPPSPGMTGLSGRPVNAPAVGPRRPPPAADMVQQVYEAYRALGMGHEQALAATLQAMKRAQPMGQPPQPQPQPVRPGVLSVPSR